MLGLSVASLFGYRSGSIKISAKAWSKLEQAERAVSQGPAPPPSASPSATSAPPRFDGVETDPAMLAVWERIAMALEKLVKLEEKKSSKSEI